MALLVLVLFCLFPISAIVLNYLRHELEAQDARQEASARTAALGHTAVAVAD